jgi:hypothetical protein
MPLVENQTHHAKLQWTVLSISTAEDQHFLWVCELAQIGFELAMGSYILHFNIS